MIEVRKYIMKCVYYKGNIVPVTVLKFIKKNIISINENLEIISKSKGKGFSGTIKRFNFSSNYSSHGNSKAHRKPGSIGMCQDPGRVFKGKKMPGRMGNNKISKKNFKIYYVDNNFLYLKGNLPGHRESKIFLNDIK
ncbi:50S ribosomal protein L3 [Candidatus Vidania fulgoroideorum]